MLTGFVDSVAIDDKIIESIKNYPEEDCMKSIILVAATFALTLSAQARGNRSFGNTLVLGQGISSPSLTSQVNFKDGFGSENAAGASLYVTPQVNLMYNQGDNSGIKTSNYGAELAFGNGKLGLAAGYMKYTAETAGVKTEDDNTAGRIGMNFGKMALGIGYLDKNRYSAGLLINPVGMHKFGVIYETYKDDDVTINTDESVIGAGYTYDARTWAFTLDASKKTDNKLTGTSTANNDIIKLTPAFLISNNWLVATVGYDMYLSDKNDIYKDVEKFMAGLGFKGDVGQLALYHKYSNDIAAVGTIWF